MPKRATVQRAKQKLRRGRRASTAAGEFVREEMHHIREGKHGARSTKQAIAIGLSKARRAGVPLRAPARGTAQTKRAATRDYEVGQHHRKPRAPSSSRGRAVSRTLRREPRGGATRSDAALRAAARKAAALRKAAARKAAANRKRRPSRRTGAAHGRSRTRA